MKKKKKKKIVKKYNNFKKKKKKKKIEKVIELMCWQKTKNYNSYDSSPPKIVTIYY